MGVVVKEKIWYNKANMTFFRPGKNKKRRDAMSERTLFSPKDVFISWNHLDVEEKNLVKEMIEEKG